MSLLKLGVCVAAGFALAPWTITEIGVGISALLFGWWIVARLTEEWQKVHRQRAIDQEFQHVANLQKAATATQWQAEARVIQGRKIR